MSGDADAKFAIIWALLLTTQTSIPKCNIEKKTYCTVYTPSRTGFLFAQPGSIPPRHHECGILVLNISNVSYRMKRNQERYQGIKEVG
ncbi:hypothetical protein FJTKL_06490 [Diaporthe vaccinii]|uniref:Secreted protein n=1 Tax=Diaporthe vaccinii TaxID=105482 RepID=A0ABR4EX19_9PEZI